MMLKIRTHRKEEDGRIGWYLIDGIKSIKYEYMSNTEANSRYDKNGGDESLYTMKFEAYKDIISTRICEMYINLKDETHRIIYVDDVAYILNDEGKTADRIFA